MKLCIVSPHLDDAILSCGLRMLRHAADEVVVLGIFTAGAAAEARKREDLQAMAAIGATAVHLDERDAPDRDPIYRSPHPLLFAPLDPADPTLARVERRVREFLADHAFDLACFPLAVGEHIDHRIAHAVGRRVRGTPVKFYEDRPYVLWPGVLQGRMHRIGAATTLPAISAGVMRATVDDYHYLAHFVPRDDPRVLAGYLDAVRDVPSPVVTAHCEELTARAPELHALYECLRRYTSQMPCIYPDRATFVQDSLRHEHTRSGAAAYVERAWTLAP